MTKLTARKSTSPRLTDIQLFVLSHAAQREDGAVALPDGMTEKAAQKLAATLVEKALVREMRAKPDMPVWGRSEEGRSHSLIINELGRSAIKAEDDGVLEDAKSVVPGAASTDKAAAQWERGWLGLPHRHGHVAGSGGLRLMNETQSRQPVATPAAQTLEAELDRIAALGLDEVRALWREITQRNAPSKTRFMVLPASASMSAITVASV